MCRNTRDTSATLPKYCMFVPFLCCFRCVISGAQPKKCDLLDFVLTTLSPPPPPPQTRYLLETPRAAAAGRSACPTPRCSSKNWRGSTPPINSSPKTKGDGYPRRHTWQRDKWPSGSRTGGWRRKRLSINSRVPVSKFGHVTFFYFCFKGARGGAFLQKEVRCNLFCFRRSASVGTAPSSRL